MILPRLGVDMPGSQEGKQGQAGSGGVGFGVDILRAARVLPAFPPDIKAPAAVVALVPAQPEEPILNRSLRGGRPSFTTQDLGANRLGPARKRRGHVLGVGPDRAHQVGNSHLAPLDGAVRHHQVGGKGSAVEARLGGDRQVGRFERKRRRGGARLGGERIARVVGIDERPHVLVGQRDDRRVEIVALGRATGDEEEGRQDHQDDGVEQHTGPPRR